MNDVAHLLTYPISFVTTTGTSSGMYMYNVCTGNEGKFDLRKEMINIRCVTSVNAVDG